MSRSWLGHADISYLTLDHIIELLKMADYIHFQPLYEFCIKHIQKMILLQNRKRNPIHPVGLVVQLPLNLLLPVISGMTWTLTKLQLLIRNVTYNYNQAEIFDIPLHDKLNEILGFVTKVEVSDEKKYKKFLKLLPYLKNIKELYLFRLDIIRVRKRPHEFWNHFENLCKLKVGSFVMLTFDDIKAMIQSSNMRCLQYLIIDHWKMEYKSVNVIANSENMRNLRELHLRCDVIDKNLAIRTVMESQYMTNLQSLTLNSANTDADGINAIATSNKDLLELRLLSTGTLKDEHIRILVNSINIKNLRTLELSHTWVTDEGARFISESSNLQNLEKLAILGQYLTLLTANYIASSDYMYNLKELNLSFSNIGDEGVLAIAESSIMKNLEKLELTICKITDMAVRYIAQSENLKNLKNLNLSSNLSIGLEGAQAIASSQNMKNLQILDLSENLIDEYSAKAMAKSQYLINLNELVLDRNKIGYKGVKAIANSKSMQRLDRLRLSEIEMNDDGAIAIAQSKYLRNLTELDISDNNIGDQGIIAIATSESMRHLEYLYMIMNSNKVTGIEAVIAIAESEYMSNLEYLALKCHTKIRAQAIIAKSNYLKNLKNLVVLESKLTNEEFTNTKKLQTC